MSLFNDGNLKELSEFYEHCHQHGNYRGLAGRGETILKTLRLADNVARCVSVDDVGAATERIETLLLACVSTPNLPLNLTGRKWFTVGPHRLT